MLRRLIAGSMLLMPAAIYADSIEISGGGHLSGEIKSQGDFVVVEVDDEIQVALPRSRVRRMVDSGELAKYQELAAKTGDDAELNYKLAIWCVTGNNVPGRAQYYKRFHLQRAVELDPDHPQARAALGFKKHEGKWIRSVDLMHDRGMISVGGRWELPEAVALNETAEASEIETKTWKRDVSRLVGIVTKGSSKAGEAMDTLRAINDPMAAGAIADQLLRSRNNRSQSSGLRRVWIDLLGRFKNRTSVQALVRAGIEEPDATLREAALKHLQEYGASSAAATYLPMLKANDHDTVNRAARALSWFPDPEMAMEYVNALVTTQTTTGPAGAGMNVGFGDNGANGMSSGSQPIVNKSTSNNTAVLALLKEIEPDADFGYDERAWQAYFAAKKTAFSGDLRRDR
ncbi:hypothetical protein Poly51_07940 [Rubripirellula tenax]|uniref:HEAT repeat protein n=1 Tax=Rubripirellula tenax TaxID=2528015 RepID=A0A5C6FGF2_9BACT|nr:HEAT repeat domain-containing protein [Rubripirellula tenax]TWU60518.1 hypothetical protein Poly51_07940 [Rubripirellula tenax]